MELFSYFALGGCNNASNIVRYQGHNYHYQGAYEL